LVRRSSAPLTHDRALHGDIARLAEAVREGAFARILRDSNR
jgi:histidine ammonia-lyase